MSDDKKRYYAKPITPRGSKWHVIGPNGLPVYDNEPNGNDRPLVFNSEGDAVDFAERCNHCV